MKNRIALLIGAFLFFFALFPACTGRQAKTGDTPLPGAVPNTPPIYQKIPGEPIRVTVVFGGAGVASFATIGFLKKLEEENIVVEAVIASGWPALLALSYGFSQSVNDLEWFGMRLQEKDFYQIRNSSDGPPQYSDVIEKAFRRDLNETRIPIILSLSNTELSEPEIVSQGEWKTPLQKTISIPGLYRPYPKGANLKWMKNILGLDAQEAVRRGVRTIIAVEMYDDFYQHLHTHSRQDNRFGELYAGYLKKSVEQQFKFAHFTSRIALGGDATQFKDKRKAIALGAQEAARIARLLR